MRLDKWVEGDMLSMGKTAAEPEGIAVDTPDTGLAAMACLGMWALPVHTDNCPGIGRAAAPSLRWRWGHGSLQRCTVREGKSCS